MKNLIQAAVVTMLTASTAQAQQAVQWKASDGGNGHWYQSQSDRIDWPAAKLSAERVSGHLATITSSQEMSLAFSVTGPFPHWLGGKQAPGSCEPLCGWQWVTGEPWNYANWNPAEPNNMGNQDTLKMYEDGSWDDTCGCELQRYLIEWDADCNGDDVVDYGQCHDGTLPDYNGNNIPDCCERGEACVDGKHAVQWRTEDGGNGHWYAAHAVGNAGIDWNEATAVALGQGAHLATITSAAEGEFIWTQLASNPSCWRTIGNQAGPRLGGFYSANGWQWVTGEPWNYSNGGSCFGPVHYENTLHFGCEYFENRWNDQFDWDRNSGGAILEWDADCNSDGIVDYGQILTGQLSDTNTDGIPDACQCATYPSLPGCCLGDLDHDATVGGADIGLLLSNWGPCGSACPYDLNGDDKVNGGDLGLMLASWGPCPH